MARRKTSRDPFEVELDEKKVADLTEFLAREIDFGIMARTSVVGDDGSLDDAHMKYLGGDGTLTKDTPWPGAANLGSYLVTEKVDAMRARIMATVFTDPIWIVEGFGKAAERAPVVEEFMQWKADQTKLHQYVGRAVHNALIEGTGVLEVTDRVTLRKGIRKIRAVPQQDEQLPGKVLLDNDGNPVAQRDKNGKFVEAEPGQPSIEMIVSDVVRANDGPSYRVLSLKDFYILPGHANELEDVWGYAKRIYPKLADLQCRERDGFYKNVDKLGGEASSERMTGTGGVSQMPALQRQGQDVAPQQDARTAEKEIWELTLLLDLDEDDYLEWYIITFSVTHRQILRIQYQNYDTPNYILLTPFPRPGSVYGFSYAKDKLGSLYDEHTALRNMYTDRMAIKNNAPIMVVEGGLWNPATNPWGPGKRIPVRDINEMKQFEVADVPQSVVLAAHEVIAASERISGMNDTTTGQLSQADRTLGEVKLVTQQSWIRIDEVVKNMQQGFEDLFNCLLTIWKNKLQDAPEPWPGDLLISMEGRALQLDEQITADMLAGTFRGKPRGSVESSDFGQMRADMTQMITALVQLSQQIPALKQGLNNPAFVRSLMTQIARVHRWPDRANLLGGFTGTMPPPPPTQPEPPKVSISVRADAATDPLAQEVLAKATGQPAPPPVVPPAGITGIANQERP